MRHRNKKIKFKGGKDANKMLARKLVVNFFDKGKLTTTLSKAKILKSLVEKLVEKSKERNESNKNYLLRFGMTKKMINFMFDSVGKALKNIKGGYVKVVRLGFRQSDGSMIASVEWAYPIVIETKEEKKEKAITKGNKEVNQVNKK